jgi:hypothetical protein
VGLKSSVVYAGNSNLLLSVPSETDSKFVRTLLYVAANEICNNNLKQITFARDVWRRSSHGPQPRTAVPAWSDLLPEVSALYCPLVGSGPAMASYSINNVLSEPECFISASHILEEPE